MFSSIDLAALVAVADTGSVRAAAAALGRTQPAITHALRRLEAAVGFALLDRSSYRARLTREGEIFVRRARATVSNARSLRDFATLLSRGVELQVSVAVDGAIPSEAWIELIAPAARAFPETQFDIRSGQDQAPLRRLAAGEVDLAILFEITERGGRIGFERKQIGQVEFCTVVRSDMREHVQENGARIPQILVADFDDVAAGYGAIEGHRHLRVSTHPMQAKAVLAGLGWGTVPRSLITQALASGELAQLSHLGLSETSSYAYSLYRRRDRDAGPVSSLIWDSCDA